MGLPQEFKDRVRCQLGDSYEDFLAEYKKERVYGLRYNPLKIEKKRLVDVLDFIINPRRSRESWRCMRRGLITFKSRAQ